MPQKRLIIQPPRKGYAEVFAHHDQPRFTSSDVLNVMILEPLQERFRVAQRMGLGKYDLYDFHTGGPYSFSTVTVPPEGGNVTINLPTRGCPTITSTTLVTLTIPDGCQNGTIQIPADANNTGQTQTGKIFFSVDGTPGGEIPVDQPPTNPGDPPTPDPTRPWLQIRTCDTKELLNIWYHQNVLAKYNALPVVKRSGTCYEVTGKRDADPSGEKVSEWHDADLYETCTACNSTKKCYYIFVCVYDCDTETWGPITQDVNAPKCLFVNQPPAVNEWWFDGDKTTNLRTYYYYIEGIGCVDATACLTWPEDPLDPATLGVVPDCQEYDCEACGDCCFSTISKATITFTATPTLLPGGFYPDVTAQYFVENCSRLFEWSLSDVDYWSLNGVGNVGERYDWRYAGECSETVNSGNFDLITRYCVGGNANTWYFSRNVKLWSRYVGEGEEETTEYNCGPTQPAGDGWIDHIMQIYGTVTGDCCGCSDAAVTLNFTWIPNGGSPMTSMSFAATATITISNSDCCKDGETCAKGEADCTGDCVSPPP